jgi:hypothetical protein
VCVCVRVSMGAVRHRSTPAPVQLQPCTRRLQKKETGSKGGSCCPRSSPTGEETIPVSGNCRENLRAYFKLERYGSSFATGIRFLSRLNGWPARSPADAPPTSSRMSATARGRCGSLHLHRNGLAPSTSHHVSKVVERPLNTRAPASRILQCHAHAAQ